MVNITKSDPKKVPGVITLEGDLRKDTPPSVVCTCGWSYGPSTNLLVLGRRAKNHSLETGCKLRDTAKT